MRYAQGGGLTAKGRGRRELVRLEAARKFEQRVPHAVIAAELRVSERSVRRWRRPGCPARRGWPPRAGCAVGLDEQQLARWMALAAGPLAAGWEDQRWTLAGSGTSSPASSGCSTPSRGSGTCCAGAVDLPAGRAPGHQARRRRGRGVEEGDLAADKSTAAALGGWIVFEDQCGQSMRPPGRRPGGGAGSPRSSGSAAAAPGTSRSPGWPATGPPTPGPG